MAHLLPAAFGAELPFDFPKATGGEAVQPARAYLPDELEWSKVKPILMVALQLAVAATFAAGTILLGIRP